MAQREMIGAILVREGLITDEELTKARGVQTESGEALTRVLVEEEMIDETELVRVLAGHTGIDFVTLADLTVDPLAAALIPETPARRYSIIPYGFEDDALLVAMADPSNVLVVDDIRAITGMRVVPRIATRSDVDDAIRRIGRYDETVADLADMVSDADGSEDASEDLSKIQAAVEEAPIIKLVNTLVTRAVNERASDIHVEPGDRVSGIAGYGSQVPSPQCCVF